MVSLNPNIAAELKMISTNFPDIEQGVLVYRVMIGSPAYKSVFVSLSNSKYFIMVALCNRADHHIFILFLLSSSFFFFFSSPNLSGRRLDVYHTLAHGVSLVQI